MADRAVGLKAHGYSVCPSISETKEVVFQVKAKAALASVGAWDDGTVLTCLTRVWMETVAAEQKGSLMAFDQFVQSLDIDDLESSGLTVHELYLGKVEYWPKTTQMERQHSSTVST